GLRRLATIDVLGYHFRVEVGGLRLTRLPLSGDRVALGVTASARLRRRRYPQIDRRPLHRRRPSPRSAAPVAGCSPRARRAGRDETVRITPPATDAHPPRRLATGAGTSPLSLAPALPHDLRRRPRAAMAGRAAAEKPLSRQCLGDRGRA